jgi:hypothetical protein
LLISYFPRSTQIVAIIIRHGLFLQTVFFFHFEGMAARTHSKEQPDKIANVQHIITAALGLRLCLRKQSDDKIYSKDINDMHTKRLSSNIVCL